MFSCNVYSVPAINIVSSVFSLADCTLEKQLSNLGLVSAGSNGIALINELTYRKCTSNSSISELKSGDNSFTKPAEMCERCYI